MEAQRYSGWELIAVDTGSTDGSREVLERWSRRERRVRAIFVEERQSYPTAINLGLAHVRGEFIARIESDDVWHPERLSRQTAWLDEPAAADVGVCGSDAYLIDELGRVLGVKRFPRSHEACMRAIWYRNPFCHSAVLMRRAMLESCGYYDERYACAEDLDLWLRMGRISRLCNLPEPMVQYRVWEGSATALRLWQTASRARLARRRAVREFGFQPSWAARAWFTMAPLAALLPSSWVRWAFHRGLGWLSERSQDLNSSLSPVKPA